MQFLFGQGDTSLIFLVDFGIFPLLIFFQVFFGEAQGQFRLFDIGLGLIAYDFQIFFGLDIGGLCVLDGNFLVDFIILNARGIQFDEQVALVYAGAFRNQEEDSRPPFNLAFDNQLFARLDGTGFEQIDDQRPFLNGRIQFPAYLLAGKRPSRPEIPENKPRNKKGG